MKKSINMDVKSLVLMLFAVIGVGCTSVSTHNSAKCFDLVDSQELIQLYDKHNPCESGENWLSLESFEKSCN